MKVRVRQLSIRLDLLFWLTLTTALIILAGQVQAMPPHPDLRDRVEAGLVKKPLNDFSNGPLGESFKVSGLPSAKAPAASGVFKALCLLVDFSDEVSQVSAYKFDSLIFADRSGTVHDYYSEVSYGQLDIVAVVLPSSIGWLRAPQSYAYYVDDNYGTESPYPNNSQKLCEDLVDLADPLVDFSEYDNDGNGFVDVVIIAHAGAGAEFTGSSSDIWSHKWSIIPRNYDGVNVSDYTIVPEYWIAPGDLTIGVFCHELGHAFGLPDLYDTDGSSNGVGDWSLMSSGSWNGYLGNSPAHPDAWCKQQLGWATPTMITSNLVGQAIPEVETNAAIFKVSVDGVTSDEYYLVENRQKIGYDAALPGSGLLIWHVDDQVWHNQYEWYPGHTTFGHYLVALEQADNLFSLEKGTSLGDAGDSYPGSTANSGFNPASGPSSDAYDGSGGYVSIVNISASGPVMTADFVISLVAVEEETEVLPQLELSQNYPNPFNPRTSFDYTLTSSGWVEIDIYNALGHRVRRIFSNRQAPGIHQAEWDGTNDDGEPVASGVYLYRMQTEGTSLVRKMILVK